MVNNHANRHPIRKQPRAVKREKACKRSGCLCDAVRLISSLTAFATDAHCERVLGDALRDFTGGDL